MNNSSESGGIGFCGLLTIVFVTLKLTDTIDWSWWRILAPLWLPAAAILTVMLLVALFSALFE